MASCILYIWNAVQFHFFFLMLDFDFASNSHRRSEQIQTNKLSLSNIMVSFLRTLRSVQRVGLREWWRQMQYIGDAKSGTFVGKDQSVIFLCILTKDSDPDIGSGIVISKTPTSTRRFQVRECRRPLIVSLFSFSRPPPVGRLCSGAIDTSLRLYISRTLKCLSNQ